MEILFSWVCYAMLCCVVLYCTVLHAIVPGTVLYCTVLYCIARYCTVLYCTVLYYSCAVLLHCTALYCTVLYYKAVRNRVRLDIHPKAQMYSIFERSGFVVLSIFFLVIFAFWCLFFSCRDVCCGQHPPRNTVRVQTDDNGNAMFQSYLSKLFKKETG